MPALRPKFYFLAPVKEIPPSGPIQLGSVISHPRQVAEPLNDVPVPLQQTREKVYLHNESSASVSLKGTATSSYGIFADFLGGLGLGLSGTVGATHVRGEGEEWSFSSLTTSWFTPTNDYVRASMDDADVRSFVAAHRPWLGRKHLYMVTGIKVAHGAAVVASRARAHGLHLNVGFDLAALGAPVTTGPELGWERGLEVGESYGSSDPFVFAFRIRRIKVSLAEGKEHNHRDFNKGALLERRDGGDETEESMKNLEIGGVEDFDAGDELVAHGWHAVDGASKEGEACMVGQGN
jgi:hypothetical protein